MSGMPNKVRWGVLSTAKIGVTKVIPGMQKGEWSEVAAIASRDLGKAETAARSLGIAKAYGSYEELLADPQIEAIYNPLPNQLHVPLTIKAAEAGKHVLCEKPLSLTVARSQDAFGGAAAYRNENRGGIYGAHSSAMVAGARGGQVWPDWAAAFCHRIFQLLQRQSREHPQHSRLWRGSPHGCGLLSHHDFKIHVRRRTVASTRAGRARSRNESGPPYFRDAGFPFGAIHLYLQHTACALPKNAFPRDQGPRRARDSI